METPRWDVALEVRARCSECPIWAPEQKALYWTDTFGRSINRLDVASGQNQSWTLPSEVGCYALAGDAGSAIVALADGLHRFRFSDAALTKLHDAPYDRRCYRFNDGRVDRRGRFWAGSWRIPGTEEPDARGAFWRLGAKGLVRGIEGVTVANGIAWSPDDRRMYIADRRTFGILVYDYDIESGEASNGRRFADVPPDAVPDGAAVDEEGGYWIALFRAGRVLRFTPDGRLDRELAAPMQSPTMVAFGGEDLGTMFLTSARVGVPRDVLDREPLSGSIFRCEPGVRGIPEPRWDGVTGNL